jgi:hypothetical protein
MSPGLAPECASKFFDTAVIAEPLAKDAQISESLVKFLLDIAHDDR